MLTLPPTKPRGAVTLSPFKSIRGSGMRYGHAAHDDRPLLHRVKDEV